MRQIFVIVLLWLVGIPGFCQTPMRSDSTEIPDFEKCFRLLEENRCVYNQYNDSIFLFRDHVDWTNFFKRRALKNTQLFLAKKEISSTVFDYFRQDREKIPTKAYRLLYEGLQFLYLEEKIDPFLGNNLCDILLDFYRSGRCPEQQNFAGWVDRIKGEFLYHIYTLGKDSDALKQSYMYLKRAINEDRYYSPNPKESWLLALENLTITNWLNFKMQTVEEYYAYVAEFRRLLQLPLTFQLMNQKTYERLKQQAANADERLVRNVYLADTTIMEKQHADSLMQEIIARNLAKPHLSELSYSRTLMMQVLIGQFTAKEAMKLARKRYCQEFRKRIKNERFDHIELPNVLLPYVNYFYLNDLADVPFRRKRAAVKQMYEDIITIYHHRLDQQMDNSYVKYLNLFATYPRAIKYLKEEERIRYLNELNVATQVTTYAHSVNVAMIARELMKGILKYRPELLKGALGEIRRGKVWLDSKKCLDFIYEAAFYHDIGKNGIISTVTNDYRPLTDEEYAIIKTHPALGAELLKIAPSLYEKYHDTTLGHHKWYNGKGGYPEDFDNTKSTKRILIDIITLSDCMQAATERVGRNYKEGKTFDMVMEEFRKGAGTKYNPDLVKFIDTHDDVARDLAVLINDAWVDIYFSIYSKFMR